MDGLYPLFWETTISMRSEALRGLRAPRFCSQANGVIQRQGAAETGDGSGDKLIIIYIYVMYITYIYIYHSWISSESTY